MYFDFKPISNLILKWIEEILAAVSNKKKS